MASAINITVWSRNSILDLSVANRRPFPRCRPVISTTLESALLLMHACVDCIDNTVHGPADDKKNVEVRSPLRDSPYSRHAYFPAHQAKLFGMPLIETSILCPGPHPFFSPTCSSHDDSFQAATPTAIPFPSSIGGSSAGKSLASKMTLIIRLQLGHTAISSPSRRSCRVISNWSPQGQG